MSDTVIDGVEYRVGVVVCIFYVGDYAADVVDWSQRIELWIHMMKCLPLSSQVYSEVGSFCGCSEYCGNLFTIFVRKRQG